MVTGREVACRRSWVWGGRLWVPFGDIINGVMQDKRGGEACETVFRLFSFRDTRKLLLLIIHVSILRKVENFTGLLLCMSVPPSSITVCVYLF